MEGHPWQRLWVLLSTNPFGPGSKQEGKLSMWSNIPSQGWDQANGRYHGFSSSINQGMWATTSPSCEDCSDYGRHCPGSPQKEPEAACAAVQAVDCNSRQNKLRVALPRNAGEKPCSRSPHGLFSLLLRVLVFDVSLLWSHDWIFQSPPNFPWLPSTSRFLIALTVTSYTAHFIYIFYLLFAFLNIE